MAEHLIRCSWCGDDALYQHYHDTQWGKPLFDDQELFANLCLEVMQVGLSWILVLRKKEYLYQAFCDFQPDKIVCFDDNDVEKLLQNKNIIRNKAKILAIIHNAKIYKKITENQSSSDYLWGIIRQFDTYPKDNCPKTLAEVPAKTDISEKFAKQLKKDGFKFLGATTCYAFMQAVGMVNDHIADCMFRDV